MLHTVKISVKNQRMVFRFAKSIQKGPRQNLLSV